MMSYLQFFLLNTATGVLLLIVALLFRKFRPKAINALYGYRTVRSMKDQRSWDLAQGHSSILMVKGFAVVFVFQLLLTSVAFFTPHLREAIAMINVFSIIPVLVYTGVRTEKVLKEYQEKETKGQ